MRKERRGFERARYVVNRRRRDRGGSDEDRVERREEASAGINGSGSADVAAGVVSRISCFRRFRRRCGSSSVMISVDGAYSGAPRARCSPTSAASIFARDSHGILAILALEILMEPLALKYSLLNSPPRGTLPTTTSLHAGDAANARLGIRRVGLDNLSKHRRHMLSESKSLNDCARRDQGNILVDSHRLDSRVV